jgi:hypothetical protein
VGAVVLDQVVTDDRRGRHARASLQPGPSFLL